MQEGYRYFKDFLSREVIIPDTIRSIIPLNESTMRMVSYVKATDLVCGIEDVEMRGVAFTHIFANPEIRTKPVIGPMYGGDAELIMTQKPDIVIVSNRNAPLAHDVPQKMYTPLIVLGYG